MWVDTGISLKDQRRKSIKEERKTSIRAGYQMVFCNSSNVRNALVLTTLFWVLIRVVSTVILTITHPAQGFTKGVVALELILGAVSTS